MSDRIAREKVEEEATQKALVKKRSKVLQRELPRPPIASLDLIINTLMRADVYMSSVVPSTLVEQAHELLSNELLSLLEHDNIKYPLDEKATKEKMKCGEHAEDEKSVSAPTIDKFDEDELKEMSVANHAARLASLQYEFENVKKKMDDETKKAQRHKQKMRATKLQAQVEAILKQLDTAEMELECFQVLKKQETLSATHRISKLWEELQKQRDLERTLQKRYGDLMTELEMVQHLVNAYRLKAERDYENAVKDDGIAKEVNAAGEEVVAPTADPQGIQDDRKLY
ncbi:hypothetical protein OROHE_008165 [Orobanche hederae]